MQVTNEERLNEWRLLLEEREKNNETIAEFCRRKNITASRYYYYQNLIKYPERVKLKKQNDKIRKKSDAKIKPIKVISSNTQNERSPIRLNLPNSVQCIFPSDMPIGEMKAIIEMLLSC